MQSDVQLVVEVEEDRTVCDAVEIVVYKDVGANPCPSPVSGVNFVLRFHHRVPARYHDIGSRLRWAGTHREASGAGTARHHQRYAVETLAVAQIWKALGVRGSIGAVDFSYLVALVDQD